MLRPAPMYTNKSESHLTCQNSLLCKTRVNIWVSLQYDQFNTEANLVLVILMFWGIIFFVRY